MGKNLYCNCEVGLDKLSTPQLNRVASGGSGGRGPPVHLDFSNFFDVLVRHVVAKRSIATERIRA